MPPATSLGNVSAQLTPLPRQLTRLVGREWEIAEVRRVLESSRLVTLTGIGGTGKTRLAVEVAERAASAHHDGVAWIDLAALSDPSLLARHVAAAMGFGESLDRPSRDILVEMLRPLSLLVVLDNCEHLVEACASLTHQLLSEAPDLRVLATSREALGVDGEVVWMVPPLSLPASPDPVTPEGIAHSEAVQFFVARAQTMQPGFRLTDANAAWVARVCRQLDGIPLAIELAAARLNVLPVEQVARRLDDVFGLLTTRSRTAPARHRTLREAIDWSHDLLDAQEQRLFRRLAVFVGGFTLDAVETVCAGDGIDDDDVLDLLSALVDKSLVRADTLHDEARCSLLEPVRQYAAEKLEASGEREALRARHALYFVEEAERAEPEIRGGGRVSPWMARLERDHGNLRAVSEWCSQGEGSSRVEIQLRLKAALVWFYFTQGIFQEPRECLEDGLAKAGGHVPRLVLGRAYMALGHQAMWQGDFAAVGQPLTKAVEILRDESDPAALSFALIGLGTAVGLAGDEIVADALFDEARSALGTMDSVRAHGFPYILLYALACYWQGIVAQVAGKLPKARASIEICVEIARRQSDHPTIAHPLSALARVLTLLGDFEGARRCLAEALPIHAKHEDRWGFADGLEGAAMLAAAEGAPERAARLIGASDNVRDSTGITLPAHLRAGRDVLIGTVRGQMASNGDSFEAARTAGRALSLRETMALALGGSPKPVATVEAQRDAAPAAPPAPVPADVAADADLRVLALGPLQVFRRGKPLEPGDWGSAKPREMLLFLLSHPGGVTREQVGLALWPESSSERVSNSFHVTLHRLRKALGDASWITKTNDRYGIDPAVSCVYDAGLFEQGVTSALRAMRKGEDALDDLRVALTWYRGPFLEEEVVGDWHLELRDRLARVHLDGGVALGEALFEAGRFEEAADAYRRVIAEDDLHEAAYRQLMLSLAHSGDRSQALRLYQRLEALLEQELQTRPEQETVEVYERLKAGE